MNRYCKRCKEIHAHIKAGMAGDRQLYQCTGCGKRHVERGDDRKKKRLTTSVAVRLNEEDLRDLDKLPGGNRSIKMRMAIRKAIKN